MHGLDALAPDEVGHLAGGAAVPDGAQRQQCLCRTVRGLLVAALIHKHRVAAAFQQGALGGKNRVLAAGQPIMAVYQQNFHVAASFCAQFTYFVIIPFFPAARKAGIRRPAAQKKRVRLPGVPLVILFGFILVQLGVAHLLDGLFKLKLLSSAG